MAGASTDVESFTTFPGGTERDVRDDVRAATGREVVEAEALGDAEAVAHGSARRAGRNVVAVVAAELLGKAATLAFTVAVARRLGAEAFGSFSYALAFSLLLATFVSWGFDSEVVRRGSADRADLDVALAQSMALRALHAVPVVLLGGVAGALARPDPASAVVLVLVLVAALLDSFSDTWRTAATACETPGPAAFVLVLQRSAACLLAVGVLLAGEGVVAVSAAYLASSAVGLVALVLLLRRQGVRPRWRALDRSGLRRMWRSAFLLGLDAVLGMALFRIDMLILGGLGGNEDVAEYAVGYRLMETVLFVTWAVSRSLMPAMVRAGSGRPLLRVGENALGVAAALLVPYGVLMVVRGESVLHLVFGAQYGHDSVVALQLLAFAPVTFALNFFCGYLLFVQRRKAQLMLTTTFAVVLNVALNLALIPAYGARGAALATTASYAIEGLVRVGLLARGTGILRIDRSLMLGAAAALPMAAVLLLPAPVVVDALLGGAVYVACYLLLARWRDPAQIAVLRSLVGRA